MISLLDQLCFLVEIMTYYACKGAWALFILIYRKSHDMDTTCTQQNNVWPLPQSSK